MAYLLPQEGMGRKIRTNAGVPGAGTSEVQTLTIGATPTGGSFKLDFKGQITTVIDWTSVDATLVTAIDSALGALSTFGGASNVLVADTTLTSGAGAVSITFGGSLAKMNVPLITVASNDLVGTGATLAVTVATPGVTATHRGAPTGAVLIDTTNGVEYYNTGTVYAPTWTATDGTLSAALLADITPGTVVASKSLIVGANKNVDTLAIAASGLKIGAGAGTAVTATAAELNAVAGVTAGTVLASKAIVTTTDKHIDTLVISDGGLKLGAGAGTAVSATAAEINGAAGADLTAASTAVAGDALVIPITHPIVLKTTAADGEALSLADGAAGQILTVTLVVDGGGDGTLTPTTKTGFVSIVFADAGDTATLIFRPTVGWMILGTAGVAAPPVIAIA